MILDEEEIFDRGEELVVGVVEQGYGFTQNLFSPEAIAGLRENLKRLQAQGELRAAGVGKKTNYRHDTKVRGDSICWIHQNSSNIYEQAFTQTLDAFVKFLNDNFQTGIVDYEFHYAVYPPGTFYKRHRDQFVADSGRKFSLITYLNEDWTEANNGQLVMYVPDNEEEETSVSLLPIGGRTVFFKSYEIPHEVRQTDRERYSITGWLKTSVNVSKESETDDVLVAC